MHGGLAGASAGAAGSVRVGILSLRYSPDTEHFCVLQADPLIEISEQLVATASEHETKHMSVGDGIVTFHTTHGDLSYGLVEYDDIREVWLARRADVADEDLE